jgi:hypothetical protein
MQSSIIINDWISGWDQTHTQKVVKTWIKAKMKVVGHVLIRHETIFIE